MDEKTELASYSVPQKRRLGRYICMWCEHQLDRAGCGSMYGSESCTVETRRERREKCLNASRNAHMHIVQPDAGEGGA